MPPINVDSIFSLMLFCLHLTFFLAIIPIYENSPFSFVLFSEEKKKELQCPSFLNPTNTLATTCNYYCGKHHVNYNYILVSTI